jgi:hypothetical protein
VTARAGLNAIAGTLPAVGTPMIIQCGTQNVTTDLNGYFGITFPQAFGTALVTFIAMAGEAPGGARHIIQGPDLSLTNSSLTTGAGRVINDAGAVVTSTAVRVNWLAIGF